MENIDISNDDDFEKIMEQANFAYEKIQECGKEIDFLFGRLSALCGLKSALEEFSPKLDSIEALLFLGKDALSPFIIGHLYSAVLGAYEVFMHSVMDSLIECDALYNQAENFINTNTIDNTEHVNFPKLKKFKESPSKNHLRTILYSTTLIDSQKVTYSIRKIFGIDLPKLDNIKDTVNRRNLFIHNGGIHPDGSMEPISIQEVLSLINSFGHHIDDTTMKIAKILAEEGQRNIALPNSTE